MVGEERAKEESEKRRESIPEKGSSKARSHRCIWMKWFSESNQADWRSGRIDAKKAISKKELLIRGKRGQEPHLQLLEIRIWLGMRVLRSSQHNAYLIRKWKTKEKWVFRGSLARSGEELMVAEWRGVEEQELSVYQLTVFAAFCNNFVTLSFPTYVPNITTTLSRVADWAISMSRIETSGWWGCGVRTKGIE